MRRPDVTALVICVVGVTITGLLLYTFTIPDFYWGTQVDETLLYEIASYGYQEGGLGEGVTDEILALNGSRIIVTITNLPNLSRVVDSWSFRNMVIERNKVSCTFENGSSIPLDSRQIIKQALSGCILPVGDWALLDAYYIDEFSYYLADRSYATKLHDDYLSISWKRLGIDDIEGWSGNVRLTDGIPTHVIWRYTHYDTIYIELNLIE
ncbi:MAG: hypothetical protein ACXADF_15195 [Candidatus Thorarchaeota archaeon]|jgi:hypothetical protein